MPKAIVPLLVLAVAACRSDRPSSSPAPAPGGAAAETAIAVARVTALPPESRGVSLELEARAGAPDGLRRDAAEGRTWLDLRKPHGLSFAAPSLLAGESPFAAERSTVTFARPRGEAGTARRHPALWRIEGDVPAAALRARIEKLDPSGHVQVAGLGEVRDQDLRVLLGRGVDVLMATAGAEHGGHDALDTHGWGGVTDGADAAVPTDTWLEELVAAHHASSLAPLDDRWVLVRRWRPSGSPRATWFRLRLADVAVASQSVLRPAGDAFSWTWEGLWRGEVLPAPARVEAVAWSDPPALTVLYKEFDPPRRGSATGGFFRALLAPLTLGADFGSSFFDESEDAGILETTLAKQRARREE